jgi:hypothetical protein
VPIRSMRPIMPIRNTTYPKRTRWNVNTRACFQHFPTSLALDWVSMKFGRRPQMRVSLQQRKKERTHNISTRKALALHQECHHLARLFRLSLIL